MNIAIIEDEVLAAQTLSRLIKQVRSDYNIVAVLQTVEECVDWFNQNTPPDLVFMDIHLADGSSFSIFDKAQVSCPIIFTTAYNEHALEAFEVNGIDYVLKPISKSRIEQAIVKFESMTYKSDNNELINRIMDTLEERQSKHKTHFLIPHRDKLVPLAINDIAYFYAELKAARVITFDSQSYPLDYSLEELTKLLNPEKFFRVNRQYIVSHKAVSDLSIWFGGKLSVNLTPQTPERVIVSKARAAEFKAWYTQQG